MPDNQALLDKNNIPEQGITIHNIVIRPVQRHSQDIENWRNALKVAEMIIAYRILLYNLYEEIILDGVLKRLIAKRILGVTKNRMVYLNSDGTEDIEIGKLLKSKQGRKLRKEVQLQKAWGISVIELGIKNGKFNVYSIPRKHILPKTSTITLEEYGSTGYNYKDAPYNRVVLEVGEYDDLGYILEAAPYVIYKRGGFGDWAQFAQVFGMPFREARYDGFNDAVRKQLVEALEQAGSAGYAVLPREAELTFHESKNNQANGQLYDDLRKACNEELAILVLGQSATTQQTPGKLGGQDTQEQTEDDLNLDDREDELSIFNEDVKPILINLGYKLDPNGEFAHKPEEEKVKPADFVNMAASAKGKLGVPVDHDQVYEVTGLRKPADYDAQIQQQQAQAEQPAASEDEPKPNNPKSDNKQPAPGNKKPAATQTTRSAWYNLRNAMADFFAPPR